MSKQTRVILTILALIAALSLGTSSAAAKATKTCFEGEEYLGDTLDEGTSWFSGDNFHVRGMVSETQVVTEEERYAGVCTVTSNANLDGNWVGPMWGKFHCEPTADGVNGYWKGRWTGYQGPTWMKVRGVGHGKGDLRGLMIQTTIEHVHPGVEPGILTGCILDPRTR